MSVKKCCETCEFRFPEQGGIKTKSGFICAGYGTRTDNRKETYGTPIEIPKKCFPMVAMTGAYHFKSLRKISSIKNSPYPSEQRNLHHGKFAIKDCMSAVNYL